MQRLLSPWEHLTSITFWAFNLSFLSEVYFWPTMALLRPVAGCVEISGAPWWSNLHTGTWGHDGAPPCSGSRIKRYRSSGTSGRSPEVRYSGRWSFGAAGICSERVCWWDFLPRLKESLVECWTTWYQHSHNSNGIIIKGVFLGLTPFPVNLGLK